jgi:glutamate/tyrosine decarboxylase-like PLP-dependent enzyme
MSTRPPSSLDLEPETMRRLGYAVVDHLIEHLVAMDAEPAWKMMTREDGESRLREPVPREGRPVDELLPVLYRHVLDNAGRIGHPRFFAFVPSAVTFPGVLGNLLAAAYNPFVGTWFGGSGPTMLELVVVEWLREMVGLPEGSGGLLTSGGSAAAVIAFAAARHHRLDDRVEGAVIYASDQTHVAVDRAAWITGFPRDALRRIPTGDAYRLDPAALRAAVAEDRRGGRRPFLVVGNAGSTNTGDVDPLDALAAVARDENLWFHVDAAYGGFAALADRGREALRGIAEADSWMLDPHKWLFQGYECGSLVLRRPELLRSAFRLFPEYMQDTALGDQRPNMGDHGLQLSRSARALGLWLSIKAFGLDAFRGEVDRALDMARAAEARIRDTSGFELLSPARLGIVCFRLRPPSVSEEDLETLNRTALTALNRSGYAFLSSTRLGGRFALRLCILSHRSRNDDVTGVLDRLLELGKAATRG